MLFYIFKSFVRVIYILLLVICSVFLVLFIKLLNEERLIQIIGCIFMLYSIIVFLYEMLWGRMTYRFYIDNKGVKFYKRKEIYSLRWSEISFIGIASDQYGRTNKNYMIYFDGRGLNFPREISNNIKDYNSMFFGVQYRKKIIKEIKKYWSNPIQGIYQVSKGAY